MSQQLITTFYTALQHLDYKTMQECYHDEATFSDPVFGTLQAKEVRVMWERLCKNAKEFSLEFSEVTGNDREGSCRIVATYTFSKTGRRVVNRIQAQFHFKQGKIFVHHDQFSFWRWSRQALGPIGLLLGWSPWFQNRVRSDARRLLK